MPIAESAPGESGPRSPSATPRLRGVVRLFLPLAFLAVASAYPSAYYEARCSLIVANETGVWRGTPDIAPLSLGGHAIVWCEIRPPSWPAVMLSVMGPDGLGPAVLVSAGAATSRKPRVACSPDGSIHVVWEEQEAGFEPEVFYRMSADGGRTFTTPPRNLSEDAGRSADPDVVAGPSGRIHVVWADDTPGLAAAMYRASDDAGATFSAAQNLSAGTPSDPVLRVAVAEGAGGKIVAAWATRLAGRGAVRIARSRDGGASFDRVFERSGTATGFPEHVAVVASPLNAGSDFWYVAWNETDRPADPRGESRVWLFSFDGGQLDNPAEIPVVTTIPVSAGLSFEGLCGVDLQANGAEVFMVFEGRKDSGRREVFLGRIECCDTVEVIELSRVAGEGEYGIDREAAGMAQDFRAPRGGNPAVFQSDEGVWLGEATPIVVEPLTGCY